MSYDAVIAAPAQAAAPPDAVFGVCPCGAKIMWAKRCPQDLKKLCCGCAKELVAAHPGTRLLKPGGKGEFRP